MAKSQASTQDLEQKLHDCVMGSQDHMAVFRAQAASYNDSFIGIDTGVNAKNGMTWRDYDYFRPEEAVPRSIKGLAKSCDVAYFRVPIVRTAVDLMSDFGCQGIHIVHPNKNNQKFFNDWFNYVDGPRISERFLNYLYRRGNLAISRVFGRIRETDMDKLKYAKAKKAKGGEFVNISSDRKPRKNEIPLAYSFLDICGLDIISPEISAFMGEKPTLALNIPTKLRRIIKNPKTKKERELVELLAMSDPEFFEQMQNTNKQKIPLNPYIVTPYYYKKDDWMDWAMPPLACILDSLVTWEKMQLADRSALDGAISNIRLWLLGSMEPGREVVPTAEMIEAFSNKITNHPGGGTLDLVMPPFVELIESKTTVHQFLGSAKYEPVWQAIFQGLGIPPTLTGSPTASGTTNNFIALKTLIERLEYGRSVLKRFWDHELKMVQEARGFRFPAEVHFEKMSLSDEVAEKALLRDLYDRGLLSAEALLERFGEVPDLERIRRLQEQNQVENKRRVKPGGPWNNPEPEHEYKKIALQSGTNTVSEMGVELQERKSGEKPPLEMQLELKKSQLSSKPKGVSGQGRPKNKKDSSKRKPRTVKPRTSATQIQIWAADMQARIADLVVPEYLKAIGKKNLRQINTEQFDDLEFKKFATLSAISPFAELSDTDILNLFNAPTLIINERVYDLYQKAANSLKNPTANNLRQLQIISYTEAQGEQDVED